MAQNFRERFEVLQKRLSDKGITISDVVRTGFGTKLISGIAGFDGKASLANGMFNFGLETSETQAYRETYQWIEQYEKAAITV